MSIGLFSVFVNLLMLTGPLFMLQIYDRVLVSRSEATLVALVGIVAFLFLMMGLLDHARARVLARAGARFQAHLDSRVFGAILTRAGVSSAERSGPATGLEDLEAMQRFASGPGPFAFFDAPWTPIFLFVLFAFHWLLVGVGGALRRGAAGAGTAELRSHLAPAGRGGRCRVPRGTFRVAVACRRGNGARSRHAAGRALALGAVTATDPDGDAVRYSLSGGKETRLFAIGETSGELYYVGGGEDDESGATTYELTVQASDGTHPVDTMVTVTVVDNPFDSEKSTGPQGSSEPASEDLPAGRETSGEVRVDAEPVDGTLRSPSDRDWFAVTLAPGRTYVFALEGDAPRGGTGAAPAIRGLRDANGDPVAGIVGGAEVRFTTDAAAAEAVYYIEVGGEGGSGQGTSATRGVGARSLATRGIVDTLGSGDGGSGYRLRANDITETRDATDDYPSATSTTGVVMVGGSVTGEIERSGDRDWFAVDLVEGRLYWIDLKGRSTGDGTLRDPYLRGVYDDNGVRLGGTTNNNSGVGLNSRVVFTAPADATYYLAAGTLGADLVIRDRRGTYTLSVTEVHDEFAAGTGTSGTVEVGGSATGEIEFRGDRDWFEVTLQAGKVYRFDLKGGSYWRRNAAVPAY